MYVMYCNITKHYTTNFVSMLDILLVVSLILLSCQLSECLTTANFLSLLHHVSVGLQTFTSLLNPHDIISHSYGETYPLFYFFTIHPEIKQLCCSLWWHLKWICIRTQTSSFQASTCYPQTPTFVRPGLCQTTMFQELLEAVSNLFVVENLPRKT